MGEFEAVREIRMGNARYVSMTFAVLVCALLVFGNGSAQGQVNIGLAITDANGDPLDIVDPNTNDPALGGGDFFVAVRTSDASELATYSQRINFDCTKVTYADTFAIGLDPSPMQSAGSFQINVIDANAGENAGVIVSAIGIEGFAGPQTLVKLSFNVLEGTLSGEFGVSDNLFSTVPYGDAEPVMLAYNHSAPAPYTTVLEPSPTATLFFTPWFTPTPTETPFTPTPTLTETPTPTLLPATATPTLSPTPSPTPDADFNGDGTVDMLDLLILMRAMREDAL
jgi:hypothetical protein